MNKQHTLLAACVFIISFFILFPYYRYLIDIDGISYIKVAERIANSDYGNSLNGYWSPLSSWLLVPFIKLGYNAVLVAKYINGLLGLLCIFSFSKLANQFAINEFYKKLIPYFTALVLLSCCFNELCADLLSVFIISLYLNLIYQDNFFKKSSNLILAAAFGALAYFAKAYNFYFFLIHISFALILFCKKETNKICSILLIKKWLIVVVSFFMFTSVYIFSISKKYNHFTINTAGKLNTTWFLAPGLTDTQRLIIPPPYKDAVSNWDDPSYQQKLTISPFTNITYFKKQIKLTAYNAFTFSKIVTEISVFSILLLAAFTIFLLKNKKDNCNRNTLLLFTALLYPAGYLLIIIEWRYIWLLHILIPIMAGVLLSNFLKKNIITPSAFKIACIVFLLSCSIKPIMELILTKGAGTYENNVAKALKQNHITGNFFSPLDIGKHQASAMMIAYLTNSKLMGAYNAPFTSSELAQAVRQYNIQYVLKFYDGTSDKNDLMQNEISKIATAVYSNLHHNVVVYKMY